MHQIGIRYGTLLATRKFYNHCLLHIINIFGTRLSHLYSPLEQFRNLAIVDLKKTSPHKIIFVAVATESIYRINVILMYPLYTLVPCYYY